MIKGVSLSFSLSLSVFPSISRFFANSTLWLILITHTEALCWVSVSCSIRHGRYQDNGNRNRTDTITAMRTMARTTGKDKSREHGKANVNGGLPVVFTAMYTNASLCIWLVWFAAREEGPRPLSPSSLATFFLFLLLTNWILLLFSSVLPSFTSPPTKCQWWLHVGYSLLLTWCTYSLDSPFRKFSWVGYVILSFSGSRNSSGSLISLCHDFFGWRWK